MKIGLNDVPNSTRMDDWLTENDYLTLRRIIIAQFKVRNHYSNIAIFMKRFIKILK